MTIPNMRPVTSIHVSRKRPASSPTTTPTSERDEHRRDRQLEGGAAVLDDDVGHWPPVGDRRAEVALDDPERYSQYCW